MSKTSLSWLLLTTLLLSGPAWSCGISTSNLAFGSYNFFDNQPTDSTAILTVDCESAYTVSASEGQAGTFSPRAMSGNADNLQYNLFTSASYSIILGDGSGGTQVFAGTGDPQPVDHVVHGRIFAGQNIHVGSYSDLITVTLEF